LGIKNEEKNFKKLKLRKVNIDDFDFLYKLKKKTLKDYISKIWGWDEEWQKNYFTKNFKPEVLKIITKSEKAIGCISFLEETESYFLSLIEISPEYQNQGIGTKLINDLISEARIANRPVKLHVLKINERAQKLYKKLGFINEDESETHVKMIYRIP